MKLKDIVEKLGLELKNKVDISDVGVKGGYASDLLSDVLGNAKEGDIWVTLQTHQNVVAVSSMKGISAIAIIGGKEIDEEVLKKATEENMPMLATKMPAFELIGKLYSLGVGK